MQYYLVNPRIGVRLLCGYGAIIFTLYFMPFLSYAYVALCTSILSREDKDWKPTNRIMQPLEAAVFATTYPNLNLYPV